MIQLQHKPLPAPQAEAIQHWLDMPGAIEFQKYVSAMSAEATANFGNLTLDNDPNTETDRQDALEMARRLDGLNTLIDQMRVKAYKFEVAVLESRTHITTNNPN
jgi:hypothetical protein